MLFRGRRLFSRVIQLRTGSPFSHVGIAHWIKSDGVQRLAVVEALEGVGVRLHPLSEYLARGILIDWWAITDESIHREKVVSWAMQRWGKRYASPWQLARSFGFLGKLLANWLGLPTKVDADRWFCSFFATSALRNGGWAPEEGDPLVPLPEQAAPGDLTLFPCLQRRGTLVLHQGDSRGSA